MTLPAILSSIIAAPTDSSWGWLSQPWYRPSQYTFPYNSRTQEVASVLAWFYTKDRPWNPYYQNDLLGDALIASVRYYVGTQLPSGAFQEYTTNVNSFPATGFGIMYRGYIYSLLEEQPVPLADLAELYKKTARNDIIAALVRLLRVLPQRR